MWQAIAQLAAKAYDQTLDTIETGYNIYNANRNFKLQQETFDYQKDLQQQIFNREDNAVQRRVADLKAAGLSPVLAAGSAAGAGQAIPMSTPQHSDIKLSGAGIGARIDVLKDIQTMEFQREQINLLKKQIVGQEVANAGAEVDNNMRQLDYDKASRDFEFDVATGRRSTPRSLMTLPNDALDMATMMFKYGIKNDIGRFLRFIEKRREAKDARAEEQAAATRRALDKSRGRRSRGRPSSSKPNYNVDLSVNEGAR